MWIEPKSVVLAMLLIGSAGCFTGGPKSARLDPVGSAIPLDPIPGPDGRRATTAAQLVLQAYAMDRDWEAHRRQFAWTAPEVPRPEFNYSAPVFGRASGRREPFAFVAWHDAEVYLIFRGTVSIHDWLVDLDASQTPYTAPGVEDFGYVHRGFKKVYAGMIDPIRVAIDAAVADIRSRTDGPIHLVVSGHSLGAGVAILAVPEVHAMGVFDALTCITFANPRVGDTQFSRRYRELGATTYRFVNTTDLVPDVPPAVMNHRNVYQPVTNGRYFTRQYGSNGGNHHMEHYADAVYEAAGVRAPADDAE